MYINGSTNVTYEYNGFDYTIIVFDIYGDTNYWDSNVLDNNRDLFCDISIGGTDLLPSKNYNIEWFYSSYSMTWAQLNTFYNSDGSTNGLREHLQSTSAFNKQEYLFNTNAFLSSYNNMSGYQDWNTAKYVYMFFTCEDNNAFIDDIAMNVYNKFDSPFYSVINNATYQDGYNTGYQNGLSSTQQSIYEDGYQSGYDEGYLDGAVAQQDDIYDVGYNYGYETGYRGGYNTGYDKGHLDGIDDAQSGEYELSTMVVKVADTPINIFKSIFDIEFMGINLVPILFGFTALGIGVWLLRRFMGGD